MHDLEIGVEIDPAEPWCVVITVVVVLPVQCCTTTGLDTTRQALRLSSIWFIYFNNLIIIIKKTKTRMNQTSRIAKAVLLPMSFSVETYAIDHCKKLLKKALKTVVGYFYLVLAGTLDNDSFSDIHSWQFDAPKYFTLLSGFCYCRISKSFAFCSCHEVSWG